MEETIRDLESAIHSINSIYNQLGPDNPHKSGIGTLLIELMKELLEAEKGVL